MGDSLLVDRRGHTTVFTLNRPDRRNSYDDALVAAIREAMEAFDDDPDQHIGILTGAGDAAFSSGSDLSGGAGRHGRRRPTELAEMFGVGAVTKPMIAAVNGLAVGGGFELALSCDIRIASDQAWFGLLEPKRGIVAGVAAQLLPRMISFGDAAWLLLTAERVSAEEAHRMGLVQRVVRHAEVLDEALSVAATMGSLSQVALQATKRLMSVHRNALLGESALLYEEVIARLSLGDDRVEGMRAFAEKRDPQFTNRWPQRDSPDP
jgi:enoyl-CoA hydratase/carnithine racemase